MDVADLSTLEFRSRTLPGSTMMTDTSSQPGPTLPIAVICSAPVWQHDPAIFSDTDDTDMEDWLASGLLRTCDVSTYNKWDDGTKLSNVIFYLTDVTNLWFRNHEANITIWAALKMSLTEVFSCLAVWKLRAEQQLRSRAQLNGEHFTSYIQDVVNLCKRLNPSMSEADKLKHILKDIEDDAPNVNIKKFPNGV